VIQTKAVMRNSVHTFQCDTN